MGKNTQRYNPVALFMEGLLAFGKSAVFAGWDSTRHLTPKQQRGRKAFKAQRIARRKQQQALHA